MPSVIDLHAHSTVSDGGDSPRDLIARAVEVGLTAIAITDHDNDSGCAEAIAAGADGGIEVIPGVEISCDVDALADRGLEPRKRPTMHLLGYFVPQEPNPLSDALAELQDARANRNRRMVERLNDLGIPLTFEEVEMEAGGPGAQIGRPHFAAVLVRHGAVPDYQSAFDKYLAKGAPGYMSRKLYKPEDAIELMTLAGVVPVLAHPFTLHLDDVDLASFVSDLAAAGLAGIEGWHGDRPAEDQRRYRDLAEKLSLIVTGGSDYHGHMRPDRPLRGGKHGVTVPPECLDDLRAAARSMSRAR